MEATSMAEFAREKREIIKERVWTNVEGMKLRVKERFGVSKERFGMSNELWRLKKQKALKATAATTGGLVVARVFKGNVVFSRMVHGVTTKKKAALEYIDSLLFTFRFNFRTTRGNSLHVPKLEEVSLDKSKLGQKIIIKSEDSKVLQMLQAVAVPLLGNVCHVFMRGLNYTEVYGAEKLQEAIKNRPDGQPLITVSNHVASMDDPLVISSVLPPRLLSDAKSLRWTLCASDRCFTNPVKSAFFRCVKVLPITRGEGLWQKGMEMALSKLNKGEWVHIFPEGSRSKDGGKTIQFAKRGVGRLVYDSTNTPLVVPFVHSGMQEVIPIGSKLPQVNKKIVVLVGDPIKVDDIINISKEKNLSEIEIYDAISLRIGDQLHELKDQLDELVSNQSLLNRSKHYQRTLKFTDSISQFFDWESDTMLSEELLADVKMSSPSLHPDTTMQHVSNRQQHHLDGAKTVTYQNEKLEADLGRSSLYANNIGLNGGVISTLKAFRDPSILLGFSARGLFANA